MSIWPIASICRRNCCLIVCFCFAITCNDTWILHHTTTQPHTRAHQLDITYYNILLFHIFSITRMLNLCAVTRWSVFAPNLRQRWKKSIAQSFTSISIGFVWHHSEFWQWNNFDFKSAKKNIAVLCVVSVLLIASNEDIVSNLIHSTFV